MTVGPPPEALYRDALAALSRDDFETALARFSAVLDAAPAHPGARLNRGVTLHRLGRDDAAFADFDALVALAPESVAALYNRGTAHAWAGRTAEAAEDLAKALARAPGDDDIRENLVRTLAELGRGDAALAAVEAAPGGVRSAAMLNAKGLALAALGRLDDALAAHDAAVAAEPHRLDAHHNRGLVLDDLGRPGEALESYARALALKPGDAEIRFCAALSHLTLGEFAAAWPDFPARFFRPGATSTPPRPDLPRWDGGAMPGGTLLAAAEQGFGDTLLFCRFVPAAATVAAARVVLVAPAPLLPLVQDLPGVAVATERSDVAADACIALPDLPAVLGIATPADLARFSAACLAPPAARLDLWAGRLGPSSRPRVGLIWRGRAERRKAPHLTRAIPLAALLGALPGNVEVLPIAAEIAEDDRVVLAADPRVSALGAPIADFADTAAIATLADLVVAIDTGPTAAALACGRETWVLPPYAPDWRWGLGRDATPWFPQARLFRQRSPGAWPLARLKLALMERFEG